jgi:hypothetical protein
MILSIGLNGREKLPLVERKLKNSPKIQNPHPVLQPSPLNIQLQHRNLRLRQRLATLRIQTARILHPGAQRLRQHASANLVVLRVSIVGVDSDGSFAEQIYVSHLRLEGGLHGRRGNGVDAVLQLRADAAAQQEGGQVAAIYDGFDEGV